MNVEHSRGQLWLEHVTLGLTRHEPWWLLLAGPPLLAPEWFPRWMAGLALGWIGVLWIARRLATGRWTVPTALDLPILALLLVLPLAIVTGMTVLAQPIQAVPGTTVMIDGRMAAPWSRAFSLLFAVAMYFALAHAVDTPRRAWSAAVWLLVGGLGLAVVGLAGAAWQVKLPAFADFTTRLPRLIPLIPHPSLQSGVHPNTIAALLVLPLSLAWACLFLPARRGLPDDGLGPPPAVRLLALAVLGLGGPILVLTQSRGAWLALAVALGAMSAGRWKRAGVLFGLGVGVAGLLFLFYIGQRWLATWPLPGTSEVAEGAGSPWDYALDWAAQGPLADLAPGSGESAPLSGRIQIWRESLHLLAAHPLTGIGLNTFPYLFGQSEATGGFYVYRGYAHSHNTLLQAALDYGLLGFTAVVGLYVAAAWAARRAWRRLSVTPLGPLVVGLAMALLAYAVYGMVDAVAIGGKPGAYIWAYAGVLAAVRYRARYWIAKPPAPKVDSAEGDLPPTQSPPGG